MATHIIDHHTFIFSFLKSIFTKMPAKSWNVGTILKNYHKKLVIHKRGDSVPKIITNSGKDNTAEEVKQNLM